VWSACLARSALTGATASLASVFGSRSIGLGISEELGRALEWFLNEFAAGAAGEFGTLVDGADVEKEDSHAITRPR
jgi:hypothetical protein